MTYQFDSKKLKECIEQAKNAGMFNGIPVSSKADIREIIASVLGCETDTIRKWEREGGTRPRDVTWINKLEELFGASLRSIRERMVNDVTYQYSESVKDSIKKVYYAMRTIIREGQWDDDGEFLKSLAIIDNERIAIPSEVYEQIEKFVNEIFKPILFEEDDVFEELRTEEYVYLNEDGRYLIIEPQVYWARYNEIVSEIDGKLEELAKEVLQPILLS